MQLVTIAEPATRHVGDDIDDLHTSVVVRVRSKACLEVEKAIGSGEAAVLSRNTLRPCRPFPFAQQPDGDRREQDLDTLLPLSRVPVPVRNGVSHVGLPGIARVSSTRCGSGGVGV